MERRGGKERRRGVECRRKAQPVPVKKRPESGRRSGLDRRDMSAHLCPYLESPVCTAWRDRTLGHIVHISRYCREYYIFCEFYKELQAEKVGGD